MRRPVHLRISRANFQISWFLLLAILLLPFLSSAQSALSAPLDPVSTKALSDIPANAEFRAAEVVVKFKSTSVGQFDVLPTAYLERNTDFSLYKDLKLESVQGLAWLPGLAVFKTGNSADVRAMVEAFNANPAVEYAEPNYIVKSYRTPNDTFYTQKRQYYIDAVNLPGAWDITTGTNKTVIAVVDTGVRNNLSLTLDASQTDLFGSFVPTSEIGGPPLRYPDGPAPPLPANSNATDGCWWPQPTPYPAAGTACVVSPLYGGIGVRDLKRRVLAQQGISTVPDCQPPRWNNRSVECDTDYNGHGTAVAGIIAANTGDGYGMAGVDWNALVLPVRSMDWTGSGAESWVAEGITQAASIGARVINLSLGTTVNTKAMADAIKYAQGKGAIIVASSGNAANGVTEYPAAYPGVIAVAATDENNKVTKFSSFGAWVSVAAPGANILTTNINWPGTTFGKGDPFLYDNPSRPEADRGDFGIVSGTSFSAPIVSGIIGLMLAVNPNLTAAQVKAILEGTATDIESPGRDDKSGYGLVNAQAAVQAVKDGNFTPNRYSLIQGTIFGANYTDVVLSLEPGQIVQNPNSSNGFRFDSMGAGTYTLRAVIPRAGRVLGPVTITLTGAVDNVVNVNFDFASGQVVTGPGAVGPGGGGGGGSNPGNPIGGTPSQSSYFNRVSAVAGTSTLYYFNETGHTLKGEFKKFWDKYGGLPVFGFPISEEFLEVSPTDNKLYTVQYFERNRFEFHPEFANSPFIVSLGLLGSELTRGRNFPTVDPVPNTDTLNYFTQTKHTLSGRFLEYWNQNGGLAIFGYPISEPFLENGFQVQYFERNRFEYHPENAGSKFDVLLGLLGIDLARNRGYIP